MRKQIFMFFILLMCSLLYSQELYVKGMNVELRKEYIVYQGNTYDVFFYNAEGEPQFLKQLYDKISLPHSVSLSDLHNIESTAVFDNVPLSSVINKEVKIYDRLRTFKLDKTFANKKGWMKIRNMFNGKNIPVWPVVTYYDSHPLVLNGEIMIQFKKYVSVKARKELIEDFNVKVVENSTSHPEYFLVKISSGKDPFEVANNMYETGLLRYSQPNWLQMYVNRAVPNDPIYNKQWHLPQINAESAWDSETGSSSIVVGIVDSGVDMSHPDLDLVNGYDFADNDSDPSPGPYDYGAYHGTAVAGISAAIGNNGIGVTGVCQKCKIMPIRLITGQAMYPSSIKNALEWTVDNGAAVINNSWGPANEHCQTVYENSAVTSAAEYARQNGRGGKGTALVFASGNDGCDAGLDKTMLNEDLVVVSALGSGGTMESYSNWGSSIDVSAGAATHSTDITGSGGENGSDYTTYFSGTSAAAPVVSGAIALMLSANPDMDFSGALQCLKIGTFQPDSYCSKGGWGSQTDPYVPGGSAKHSPCFGFGVVDVAKMVNGAITGDCAECIPTAPIDLCYGAGSGRDDNCNGTVDEECDTGGVGKAGDPCSEENECLNTAENPRCITESGWNGGYCSAECEKSTDCYNGVGGTNVICYEGKCIARCDWNEVRDGYECVSDMILPEGIGPEAVCGNEIIESGETCDGGTKLCKSLSGSFTEGYAKCKNDCSGWDTSTCEGGSGEPVCGDGDVEGDEVCDGGTKKCSSIDGVPDYGNAPCKSDCSGWDDSVCSSSDDNDDNNDDNDDDSSNDNSDSGSVCGNGIIEEGEQCDDGNLMPGDGCDPKCRLESPTGEEECGNGILEYGEECDDGNLIPGDGCDPNCRIEGNNDDAGVKDESGGCSCSSIVF